MREKRGAAAQIDTGSDTLLWEAQKQRQAAEIGARLRMVGLHIVTVGVCE